MDAPLPAVMAAPVSLADRQAAYDAAVAFMTAIGESWVEARLTGAVAGYSFTKWDSDLVQAIAAVRRTERALTRARKRQGL